MRLPSFRKKNTVAAPEAPAPAAPKEKKPLLGFLARKPPAGKIPCPKCGTLNPEQVNFCKECGILYPGKGDGHPGSALSPATVPHRVREPKVWLERGNNLFRKGQFGEAVECYTVALDIEPKYAKAWNNKALALEKIGNIQEARTCRQKFAELQGPGR